MDNHNEASSSSTHNESNGNVNCSSSSGCAGNNDIVAAYSADNGDEGISDQLIRDGTAKIESEIAQTFPLVSDLVTIDRLHTEYSNEDLVYQQKVEDLKQNYVSLRKTRPDGNCFYRAFIFAYFESLIGDKVEQARFVEVCKVTRKGIADVLGFPDFTIDEFYEYFHEIVTKLTESRITSAEMLLTELDEPAVYDNIVVYLRLLTSYYLQKESDFFANFIEGSGQIGDFCKREVEPMYKESDHIHIIALSSVLDCTVRIVYMDRGAGGKVNEHDFTPLKQEGPPKVPRIHLLYRPGHYDVLYVRSAATANGVPLQNPKSPLVVQQEEADSSSANALNDPRSPLSPGALNSPLSPATPLSPSSHHQATPTPSPRPANHDEDHHDGGANSTQPDL